MGAALVHHRRLLAARRCRPAAAAGRWDPPGGKVQPREHPSASLVREAAAELGCTVAVRRRLEGESVVDDRLRLRVALADLVDGEPIPRAGEHDAVRWLAADGLEDVDWLEPDRPFLEELRAELTGHQRTTSRAGRGTP